MNAEKLFKQVTRDKRKLAVIALGFIMVMNWGRISASLSTVGYVSGYQGLSAEFNSVYFKGYWYTASTTGPNSNYLVGKPAVAQTASAAEFFDHINLDPDYSSSYLPNLCASQSPICVDTDYGTKTYGPWSVKTGESTQTVTNWTGSYQVTTETYKEYQIVRYRCEWSVNLWLNGASDEATMDGNAHTWQDAEIWVKLTPQSFVYFADNPDKVYFAPAKIQLADAEWWSLDQTQTKSENPSIASYQDVFPEAKGEALGIFYSRGGSQVDIESETLSYQGEHLDPSIFRSEYWVRISLGTFRPHSWWNDVLHLTGYSYEFPSVKLDFEVFVFVVGEWTVQLEEGETVSLTNHDPQVVNTSMFQFLWDWAGMVNSWLGNPFNLAGLGAFGIAAVAVVTVVVLTYFFGTAWIKRLLGRGRKQ